jgi:acyl-CoA hydrolase
MCRASGQYILTDKLSIRGNLTLLAQETFASIALRFYAYSKENDNGSGFGGNGVKWMPDVFSLCAFKIFAKGV